MRGRLQTIVECRSEDGWDGIASALGRARPGDRVQCPAGDFRGAEPLRVPSGVTLAGCAGTRLVWAGLGSAVRVEGASHARIEWATRWSWT